MPRRRWIIALTVLIALLAAAEIGARRWVRPKACIQIINECDEIMDDLVVSYAETRVPVGRLLKGHSAQVWLTAGPAGPLRLDFRQKGNALQGFQIPEFDPGRLVEDASKQVLVVRTNEIQRYADRDETWEPDESLGTRIWRWLNSTK
jgi:hypothetical protein